MRKSRLVLVLLLWLGWTLLSVSAQEEFPDPFSPRTPRATVTVSKAGTGSGTVTGLGINCGSECTHSFNRGAQVTLTATPDAGSVFAGWSGGCTGVGACVVTISVAQTVTATFDPSGAVAGQEQRCADIGTACICSEPLNMTGFSPPGPDFWNPNDSTTKECTVEAVVMGGAVVRTSSTITVSTDATVLSALPSHSIARFLRANNNHQGTLTIGNGLAVSSSLVRVAARWYQYYTPDFQFAGEGSCDNAKITQGDNDVKLNWEAGGSTQVYNFLEGTPSVDCCLSGPLAVGGVQNTAAAHKGKWIRHEVVMTNRAGPGFRIQSFWKNITNGQAEVAVIDSIQNAAIANWTPNSLMSAIMVNAHRFSAADSINGCQGNYGFTHYMYAGWTTNAGQRIGSASAVEGSVPPGTI
jgi:List-Bact-rpt repeat protein